MLKAPPLSRPGIPPLRRPLAALLLGCAVALPAQVAPVPPQPTPAPVPPAAAAPPMSQAQRKALLDSVDSMTNFVSNDTGLAIRHTVKRRLIGRAEVETYLRDKFNDDESTKRLARSELVLKRFGLLPESFDLGPFLVSLLTEQIAGFYDNKTETVNLLDWVAPAEQQPVLAHELTHALQDQDLTPEGGLEKWGDSGVHGDPKTFADDQRHIGTDEFETAREAVTEGQAMVVFYDDALRPQHRTLAELPDIGQLLQLSETDDAGSPQLAKAPLLLQKSLLFPYTDGLRFEHAVLLRRGKTGAFAGVLSRPPASSWQVIHPAAWLSNEPIPSVPVPDLHPLLDPAFAPYDVGSMGELDVRILGEVLGGPAAGARLASGWKGGFYYAAQRRAATDAEKRTPSSIALIYRSRWRTAADAHSLLALTTLGLHHQYTGLRRRPESELPSTDNFEEVVASTTPTGEPDILLLRSGADVLLCQGLPLPLARQLRSLFPEMGTFGRQQVARAPSSSTLPESTLHLAALLRRAGSLAPPRSILLRAASRAHRQAHRRTARRPSAS